MTKTSALSAGDSRDYIDALLAYLGDRNPLEVFAETPGKLPETVGSITDEKLRQKPAPGKWSVLDIVQHLADAELTLGFRYRKVIAEDAPDIPHIDQDEWAENLRYNERSLDDALADFNALRAINLRLLTSVSPEAWGRHGMHSQRGKETLREMVRLYAAHDLYHLEQIERVKSAVGG
jgi:hypothetical protein